MGSLKLIPVLHQLNKVTFGLHVISRFLCWMDERYAHVRLCSPSCWLWLSPEFFLFPPISMTVFWGISSDYFLQLHGVRYLLESMFLWWNRELRGRVYTHTTSCDHENLRPPENHLHTIPWEKLKFQILIHGPSSLVSSESGPCWETVTYIWAWVSIMVYSICRSQW